MNSSIKGQGQSEILEPNSSGNNTQWLLLPNRLYVICVAHERRGMAQGVAMWLWENRWRWNKYTRAL